MATTAPATTVRPRLDRAEKLFLFTCLTLTGAFLSVLLWWGSINALPELQIPKQTPLAVNAFDDFAAASTLIVMPPGNAPLNPTFDGRGIPRKDWAKVYPLWRKKAWLTSNAPALKLVRQGLLHPYQIPADPDATMRGSAYFLFYAFKIESDVYATEGDWKGAVQSTLDAAHFTLKAYRDGQYSGSAAIRQLKSLQPHLDAATCRSAAKQLSQWQDALPPYEARLRQQTVYKQYWLLDILRRRNWATQLLRLSRGASRVYWWDLLPLQLHGKGRIYDDFARYCDARLAAAKKPYAKAPYVTKPGGIVGEWLNRQGIDDSIERFWSTSAETHTTLLITALALRAFHLEHGVYPTELTQLTPGYLPRIPADPFGGGEELRYRRQGNDYVLWSIGPDKKDNTGQPITQKPSDGYDDNRQDAFGDAAEIQVGLTSQGDWVYGKNR